MPIAIQGDSTNIRIRFRQIYQTFLNSGADTNLLQEIPGGTGKYRQVPGEYRKLPGTIGRYRVVPGDYHMSNNDEARVVLQNKKLPQTFYLFYHQLSGTS